MMINFTRTNEGGSVVTFAVVAVVLAVLVIGGVYTVQRSGQQKPSPSSEVVKSPSPAVSTESAPSRAPSVSKPPVKDTPATNNTTPLPTTGPEDTVVHLFMVATLVGMVVACAQSYRARVVFLSVNNR